MQIYKLAAYASLLAGAGLLTAAVSPEVGRTARAKLVRVTSEKLGSGESVILTEDEINSLLRYDSELDVPEGVRDLKVSLATTGASCGRGSIYQRCGHRGAEIPDTSFDCC